MYSWDDDNGEEVKDPRKKEEKRTKWQARAIEERAEAGVVPDKYGICAKCKSLQYRATRYGKERATCEFDEHKILTENDPIVTCTIMEPVGQLSLTNMWGIATFIDPDKNDPIGF